MSAVDSLFTLDPPLIREAWIRMRGCYREKLDRPPPPAIVAISNMTAEQVELYRHVPPPGHPIPVGVQPLSMDDSILEDKEISWVVRRLCLNHSGGPLGMRSEHLRQWMIAATREDTPDATN